MFEEHIPLRAVEIARPHIANVPISIETEGRRVCRSANPSFVPSALADLGMSLGEHDTIGNDAMSQTPGDGKTLSLSCPAVGRTVRLLRDYKSLVSRTGLEWARVISRCDCSDKDYCLVATHRGSRVSYDWSQCEFCTGSPTRS
jgi:hypothetical protein